jgi:hypothetical protein
VVRDVRVAAGGRRREAASEGLQRDRKALTSTPLNVRSPRRRAATAGGLLAAVLIAVALIAALTGPARAAVAQAPKGFLGVNISSILETDDYGKMAAADVGTLRTGFLYRNAKLHRDDPWNWTSFDQLVGGTAANGIDLIPVLYGVPPWISTERGSTPLGRAETAWREYLTALVERYGPDGEFWSEHPEIPARPIRVWQAWNEPNSRSWWRPKPDPKEYGRLLVLSARTIHAVDPKAKIMTAGIVAEPTNAAAIRGDRFLRGLFRSKAVRRAADLVAFHPYAPTTRAVRKQLESARKTLRRSRMARTPIWVTEIGWGSEGPKSHPLIMPEPKLESQFGKLLRMAVDERRRLNLGNLDWYHWQDHPDDLCLWCESSGLLDVDGLAKPLLGIFSAIARL